MENVHAEECIAIEPGQLKDIWDKLADLDRKSDDRRKSVHELRDDLQRMQSSNDKRFAELKGSVSAIKSDTDEIVQLFKETRGGIKTAARIGHFVKWAGGIIAAVIGVWAAFKGLKS